MSKSKDKPAEAEAEPSAPVDASEADGEGTDGVKSTSLVASKGALVRRPHFEIAEGTEFAGDSRTPPVIIIYGRSGLGKTTDALFSFPEAMFIAVSEDALRPAATVCGYMLRSDQVVELQTLTQLYNLLLQIRDAQRAQGRLLYPQYVIDDLTLMATRQAEMMKASGVYNVKGGVSFLMWTDLQDLVASIVNLIRYELGAVVVMNAHIRDPEEKDGVTTLGGPAMPSKRLVGTIPHVATSVWRAGVDSNTPGGHTGVYKQDGPSHEWHVKCRLNWRGTLPMNTAELLRGATPISWDVPRLPELAWMDPWVRATSEQLLAGTKNVNKLLATKMREKRAGVVDEHIAWVLRDAHARAHLVRMRSASRLSAFGL